MAAPDFHRYGRLATLGIMREFVAACLLVGLAACTVRPTEQVDSSIEAPPCAKPRPHVHREYPVFFGTGDTALTPRAQTILGELADHWKRAGGYFLELGGHTDAREVETARPSLALERAEVAKSFLVAQGINPQRIAAEGFGANRPRVETDAAEPLNRRVEPRLFARGSEEERRQADLDRLSCRIWLRDHCFTPSRLARAGAAACNAVLDAS